MLTLRTTLAPNGHLSLPSSIHYEHPLAVLVTFLDEPITTSKSGNAAATLALLKSPAFRELPKSDTLEIEQCIAQLRDDWDRK